MKRIVFLLVCLTCIVAGFFLKAALENDDITRFLRDYGVWIAVWLIAGLVLLGLLLVVGYQILKRRASRLLGAGEPLSESQIVEGLWDSISTPDGVTNPTPQDRKRAAVVNIGTWFMRREISQFYFNVTVTVMGGIIGAATLFLLYEQNKKLDDQNVRITLQTDANIIESVLLEGARRASAAAGNLALMDAIRAAPTQITDQCPRGLEVVSLNCWKWLDQDKGVKVFYPAEILSARIQAFAQSNSPYFIAGPRQSTIDFDERLGPQIELQYVSLERGQLAQTLARNGVSPGSSDFSYAGMERANLANTQFQYAWMPNAKLTGANLKGADLSYSNLRNTQASGADLSGTFAVGVFFNDANLDQAKVMNGFFNEADLRGVSLVGARANLASFADALMWGANMSGIDLRGANMMNADLRDADLTDAALSHANISGTNFTGADVAGATFITAWAWTDRVPKGLPGNIELTLCVYEGDTTPRKFKPSDGRCSRFFTPD
ncbi:MAG: pentapeptide repeat-containing protein [Sulfitobacter sp.]